MGHQTVTGICETRSLTVPCMRVVPFFVARGTQAIVKTKGALVDDEAFAQHLVHCALDYLDAHPLVPAERAPDIFRSLVRPASATLSTCSAQVSSCGG